MKKLKELGFIDALIGENKTTRNEMSMSMERLTVLKRPSLRFIATLPTLKLKEAIWRNTIVWKVSLREPVMIMYGGNPITNQFWVVAETIRDFTPTGRVYEMKIGIYKALPIDPKNMLIEPVDEDFYLHRKWWNRIAYEKETNEN